MAVVAIKTEVKCKLCSHPRRAEIDALIEKRSNRELDENGVRITLEYVLDRWREMGVVNPNETNLKNHWRKHCMRTTDDAVEAAQTAAADKIMTVLKGEAVVDINSDLDWLWAMGISEIEQRVARGEKSGITPDVLLRIAQEKTRRSHNETQDELLKALAGGIGKALGGGLVHPALPAPREIEGAEVIDVEAVEE